MDTSKKLSTTSLILFITIVFISGNLFAQQGQQQGPPKLPSDTEINKMVNELSAELSLTEQQVSKVLQLYTAHFSEVRASIETKGGARKSREEMESIRTEFEDDVKSVLNDEQQELFDEFLELNQNTSRRQRQRR